MTRPWGTEIRRRPGPIPFRCYQPRRHRISELLVDAGPWSERVHLVQGSRRITFAELFDSVERVAGRLWHAGLRPGDRLMILAPNSPEWVITLWASVRIGAIAALGNGWWSAAEVAHAVNLVEPRLVGTDARQAALLLDGVSFGGLVDTDTVRGWVEDHAGDSQAPLPATGGDEDDAAILIFTAGTTGFP